VDRARKFHERAIHSDDLIEPCPEQIILAALPPLPRSHRITLRCIATAKRITPKAPDQFARKPIHSAKNRRIRCHEYAKPYAYSAPCGNFTHDSITHLSIDHRLPVARKIAAYQKHHIKHLRRDGSTDAPAAYHER